MLSKGVRPVLLVGLVLAFFQQWCGISESLLNIVATGVVNLVFTLVAVRKVDRWGRRKMMLLGASGLAITYTLLEATAK